MESESDDTSDDTDESDWMPKLKIDHVDMLKLVVILLKSGVEPNFISSSSFDLTLSNFNFSGIPMPPENEAAPVIQMKVKQHMHNRNFSYGHQSCYAGPSIVGIMSGLFLPYIVIQPLPLIKIS